jgi:hypothetical protein
VLLTRALLATAIAAIDLRRQMPLTRALVTRQLFVSAASAVCECNVKQHDHGSYRYIRDCLHHPISQIPHKFVLGSQTLCTQNIVATTRISGSRRRKEICYAARALQRE